MLATKEPYDVKNLRSGWWAGALGLDDPDHAGARRVSDALLWLERGGSHRTPPGHGLLHLDKKAGEASSVVLLDARGGGGPCVSTKTAKDPRWVQVPLGLWRQEWIVVLSIMELAVLLCLIELTGGAAAGAATFIPTGRHAQYGRSEDSWRLATKGLEGHKLLEVGSVLDSEGLDKRRRRNTHKLDKMRLAEPQA